MLTDQGVLDQLGRDLLRLNDYVMSDDEVAVRRTVARMIDTLGDLEDMVINSYKINRTTL